MPFRSTHPTRDEAQRVLAGDDILPNPIGALTHAVTIACPPRDVWPWLVQMGAGRAGWYSWDIVDNGGVHSAERIVPALQHIAPGDIMPAVPGATDGFTVLRVEPESHLVLGWVPPHGGRPLVTWAFVLTQPRHGVTRLIVRARARAGYRPPFGLPMWTMRTLLPLGHAFMQRRQLLGIARRVEAAYLRRALAAA